MHRRDFSSKLLLINLLERAKLVQLLVRSSTRTVRDSLDFLRYKSRGIKGSFRNVPAMKRQGRFLTREMKLK